MSTQTTAIPEHSTSRESFSDHYTRRMTEADLLHAPMFDAVQAGIGLRPWIEQTGGMTMTITLTLPVTKDGARPGYLGLIEGMNEDGSWEGSLSFYPNLEDEADDEGQTVVLAYAHDSAAAYRTHTTLSAQGFAAALVEHYREMTR